MFLQCTNEAIRPDFFSPREERFEFKLSRATVEFCLTLVEFGSQSGENRATVQRNSGLTSAEFEQHFGGIWATATRQAFHVGKGFSNQFESLGFCQSFGHELLQDSGF